MGHFVRAFIGGRRAFHTVFDTQPLKGAVAIGQGLVLSPLDEHAIDTIAKGDAPDARIRTAAMRLSLHGPLLYIETEYFGGNGGQAAMLWQDQLLAFEASSWDETMMVNVKPYAPDPINQALEKGFGVAASDSTDQFEAVGLGKWRNTDLILQALGVDNSGDCP